MFPLHIDIDKAYRNSRILWKLSYMENCAFLSTSSSRFTVLLLYIFIFYILNFVDLKDLFV